MDTVDEEPAGYARRLRASEPAAAAPPADVDDAASNLSRPAKTPPAPSTPAMPSRPMPRALMLESQAPPAGDGEEHTNPGVKLSELRRRAKEEKDNKESKENKDPGKG